MIEVIKDWGQYLTVKEYADKKGVTVQAVYQSINRGVIDSKKMGSMVLVKVK